MSRFGVAIQRAYGVRADRGNKVFPNPGIFLSIGKDTEGGWSHLYFYCRLSSAAIGGRTSCPLSKVEMTQL